MLKLKPSLSKRFWSCLGLALAVALLTAVQVQADCGGTDESPSGSGSGSDWPYGPFPGDAELGPQADPHYWDPEPGSSTPDGGSVPDEDLSSPVEAEPETEFATRAPLSKAVTAEWHWYWMPPFTSATRVRLWFSRRTTESFYRFKYSIGGTAAFALAKACSIIPNFWMKALCEAFAGRAVGDFAVNIDQAHERKRCLTLEMLLFAPSPVLGDFDDHGGKRCLP